MYAFCVYLYAKHVNCQPPGGGGGIFPRGKASFKSESRKRTRESERFHYGAIGCNGTLMLFIAVATLIKKREHFYSSSCVLAAALTLLVWAYFGMIRLIVV